MEGWRGKKQLQRRDACREVGLSTRRKKARSPLSAIRPADLQTYTMKVDGKQIRKVLCARGGTAAQFYLRFSPMGKSRSSTSRSSGCKGDAASAKACAALRGYQGQGNPRTTGSSCCSPGGFTREVVCHGRTTAYPDSGYVPNSGGDRPVFSHEWQQVMLTMGWPPRPPFQRSQPGRIEPDSAHDQPTTDKNLLSVPLSELDRLQPLTNSDTSSWDDNPVMNQDGTHSARVHSTGGYWETA